MRSPLCLCAALAAAALAPVVNAPAHAAGIGCLPGSLKSVLTEIERKFGDVTVVSTHRPGARIAGSGNPSRHAECEAVDFTPASGTYNAVASWLKKTHRGGVGTYSCDLHHIHIDSGPTYRWHRCGSN